MEGARAQARGISGMHPRAAAWLFSAKLRDETDVNTFSGDLLAGAWDTMQLEHISLWLREPERGRNK